MIVLGKTVGAIFPRFTLRRRHRTAGTGSYFVTHYRWTSGRQRRNGGAGHNALSIINNTDNTSSRASPSNVMASTTTSNAL